MYFFISVLLLLAFSEQLFSQNLTFKDTICIEGSQASLYKKALICVAKNYKDANKVIQLKEPDLGMIIAKAVFKYDQNKWSWGGSERTKGYVSYSLTITAEENQIILEMGDFIHEPTSGTSFGILTEDDECNVKMSLSSGKWKKWIWDDLKEQSKENTVSVFNMFKSL